MATVTTTHFTPMKMKLSSLKSKAVTGRMEPYCQSVLPAGAYKRRPGAVSAELALLLLLLNLLQQGLHSPGWL